MFDHSFDSTISVGTPGIGGLERALTEHVYTCCFINCYWFAGWTAPSVWTRQTSRAASAKQLVLQMLLLMLLL
jgi:hypothetical protein